MEQGHKNVGNHFYRNDVLMTGDDGIEADYSVRNVTFYDNLITNSMTLVSLDPLYAGPFIAARNTGINIGRQSYKCNSLESGFFLYNNTIVRTHNSNPNYENSKDMAWRQDTPYQQKLRSWGFQNNITMYVGGAVYGGDVMVIQPGVCNPIDFSYNSWYPTGHFDWVETAPPEARHCTLTKCWSLLDPRTPVFSDSTRRHGTNSGVTDNISEANPFVTPITLGSDKNILITTYYTPTLANGTAPKNSGVPIVGITDGYSGTAPDRGAIISGRSIPILGDRSLF